MSRRKQAKPQHLKSDEELQAEVVSEHGKGSRHLFLLLSLSLFVSVFRMEIGEFMMMVNMGAQLLCSGRMGIRAARGRGSGTEKFAV